MLLAEVEVAALRVVHQDLVDQVPRRVAVGGREVADRRLRHPQPHGVLDDVGEGAHGGLDGGVRRHGPAAGAGPGDVGHPQQLGDALGAEERRDDRLVGLLADGCEHVGDVLAGAGDVERRDEDRDDGVDLGVVDRAVEGVLEVLGRGVGAERHLLVDHQADRVGRVGGQQAEGVGVADDGDAAPARQRLVGEQLGDVEHLLQRLDLDDPGLPEHRVDGLGRRGDLADGVAHRHALRAAPRAHRDDRLAAADASRDPGELARVADGLEVEQHDLGGVVLLPVLEEVVAGDVGAVAGADERGQAEAAVLHLLQDRRAERAGLAEEARATAGRHHRGEGGVERDLGVGVDDAERVGADQAQAVGAGQPDQAALPQPALLARLGEARRDHDQAVHALGGTVEHDVLHGLGRHGDDRHVDVAGDLADRLPRRHPGDRVGVGVDHVDASGEVAEDHVAHQRPADRLLAAAGADDRDRARREEPLDRGVLGAVLALLHHADGGVGRVDPEDQLHHAVLEGALHLVAGVLEGVDHRLVVGQHLGDELLDAALATGLGQVLEEQLPDAAALVLVLDEERHLGVARTDGVVAAHRDHLAGDEQDQRDPVAVVDLGEAVEVALGELGHRREEPVVLRLVGDPAVEVDQQVAVLGLHRPDVRRAAVAQQDVRLPVAGRRRRRRAQLVGSALHFGHGSNLSGHRSRAPGTRPRPNASAPLRRAPARARGVTGENGPHGTTYDEAAPAGRLRGAHPRHRHPRRDADVVPGVRLLRHLLPGAARRARRPQAGPAPDPLHDGRDVAASRPRARQERPRRRRGDGPAAPPRRRRDLRRAGADGAALVDAAAHRRRARQLRLARRLPRRDALHRVPDGAGRGRDDGLDRRGHRRLQAQLRLARDGAGRAAGRHPPPAGQRRRRHRGRHGDQHRPAQPGRGGAGAQAPDHPPEGVARRPDALHPRARPAHRRQDRRPRRHPRRLRVRPRHLPDARDGTHRVGDPAPQGHRRHRAALRRRHRARRWSRSRSSCSPRSCRASPTSRTSATASTACGWWSRSRTASSPRRSSSSSTARPRSRTPSASTPSPWSTASRARSASRRCSTSSSATASTSYAVARPSAAPRPPTGCTSSTACSSRSSTSTRSSRSSARPTTRPPPRSA